jgi:glutathione peroxidase
MERPMKPLLILAISVAGVVLTLTACGAAKAMTDFSHFQDAPADGGKLYTFTLPDIDDKPVKLDQYKGKVLLIVNVASKCGNTPQYKGLEAAYQKLYKQDFEILGFPANNFMHQEPGSNAQIKEFCELTYGVKFPMFGKISVKGDDIHPLYKYLTTETDFKGDIGWNFGKFLVNRKGKVIARFSPSTKIEEPEVMAAIEEALKK